MAVKNRVQSSASGVSSGAQQAAVGATGPSLVSDPLPVVKVNNANLNEIKAALDEAVKQYLIDQSFTQSNVNPMIHLALGYSSVILSIGGMLYTYLLKIDFEESKPIMWVAVSGYFILQGLLWAWKRWVEKGEVFRGKRRRVVKRIETDHVSLTTSTNLKPPPSPHISFSPHTRPSSPSTAGSPRSVSSSDLPPSVNPKPSSSLPASTAASARSAAGQTGPTYLLHMTLSTTSNSGKSLINKARIVQGRGVGEFVDADGGVEEGEVRRWVAGILGEAGLAGAEDEGMKAE